MLSCIHAVILANDKEKPYVCICGCVCLCVWYYFLSIYRGTVWHDIAHSTTTSKAKLRPDFEITKDSHTSPPRASYGCLPWVIGGKVTAWYRECARLCNFYVSANFMDDFIVVGSNPMDGTGYQLCGQYPGSPPVGQVSIITCQPRPITAQYVYIQVDRFADPQILELCEVWVYGNKLTTTIITAVFRYV